ncbi:MAG: ankyrin repeat domain-containing protein [Patescibacteria group bacterium]|nr:ankyrin repeat domain-containing protein [Patescibacteria group bacterium]
MTDADGFILQGHFHGFHLMHIAVRNDDLGYIEANKEFVNLAAKSSLEATPFHYGIMLRRSRSTLNTLVRCGANIDKKDKFGQTPLTFACAYESQAGRIESLLAHKADPNARSNFGQTPIMRAAILGPAENMKLLIDGGAEITAVQTGGDLYRGMSAVNLCRNPESRDLLERARKYQEST